MSEINEDNIILSFLKDTHKNYNGNIIKSFDDFIKKYDKDDSYRTTINHQLNHIFSQIKFRKFITEVGILEGHSLNSVFFKRLGYFLLPHIEDDKTLSSLMNEVFYNKDNYKLLKLIPKDRWQKLISLFLKNNPILFDKDYTQTQLTQSIAILMDRIAGGMNDPEFLRYIKDYDYNKNPINPLSLVIRKIIDKPQNTFDVLEIKNLINQNLKFLDDILLQKDHKGISLRMTVKVTRLRQQLDRLLIIINNLNNLKNNSAEEFLTQITQKWINFYSPKNKLQKQFSTTIYLITFLATFHNGKTGEKYITTTAKEYMKMFLTAGGGGFIVAFLCYIKLYISNIPDLSPFMQAFGYSVNYAVGFVLIYLLHFTLASKQPAMTAARISQSLVDVNHQIKYKEFANLFARLSRSQFIAFMGNVTVCFAVSTGIYYALTYFGINFLSEKKALSFFNEMTIPYYVIFWYASIAGFFLFISGLASGLIINSLRYNNIPIRIERHPFLKSFLKLKHRKKLSLWTEINIGGIMGNVILGFCLGSAFLVGKFTGLPFDIRHITFASGNLAMAFSYFGFYLPEVNIKNIIIGFASVFGIGWFNFIISFSLSLIMALKSNNIKLVKLLPILKVVVMEFLGNPYKFFFPGFRRLSSSKPVKNIV